MRRFLMVAVVSLLAFSAFCMMLLADNQQSQKPKKTFSRNHILGVIHVVKPISIFGPIPKCCYMSRIGDTTVFQLSWPVIQVYPVGCEVVLNDDCVSIDDVAASYRELAFLDQNPQTGPIAGSGYWSVIVKSVNVGLSEFSVKVRLSDGSTQTIPFVMEVGDARKEEWVTK